jgi:8-oxo-dGTP diphosphatase
MHICITQIRIGDMTRTRKSRQERQTEEQAFLEAYDPNQFERPSVAVDVVLLSASEGTLLTLLHQRRDHPFRGRFALPGGFVGMDESLEAAAERVLADKCQVRGLFLEQLYTFGNPDRDPRTRVITVAYYALVDRMRFAEAVERVSGAAVAGLEVPWEGETGGPVEARSENGQSLPLAFDHAQILGMAVKRLRGKLGYAPIGYQLLPSRFTLLELQRVHETILSRSLNKDSFRRKMLASGELEATGESQKDVDHRPAELYRFARRSAV